jgi:hypothetical protein
MAAQHAREPATGNKRSHGPVRSNKPVRVNHKTLALADQDAAIPIHMPD